MNEIINDIPFLSFLNEFNEKQLYIYKLAYNGNLKELRESINYLKKTNPDFHYGDLALIVAYTGNTKILKYLINNHLFTTYVENKNKENCFLIATDKCHIKILKILVNYVHNTKNYAFICNARNNRNFNPVHIALYNENIKILKYLINIKSNILLNIGFNMYKEFRSYGSYYEFSIRFNKIKSIKFLDKQKYIFHYIVIFLHTKYMNNKTLRYFYGKGRRLYGYRIYFNPLHIVNNINNIKTYYINHKCNNKLLFI
jgi:ankyrin repeat protein